VDASSIALGAMFSHPGEAHINHPITLASRNFSTTKHNYTTTEHEGLGMVYTLHKFRHYMLGSNFKMYIDHSALRYLFNKLVLGGDMHVAIIVSGI
jgi:hypothetical protein